MHPITLNTRRLILRSFVVGDAEDVRRLAGDRAIADTTTNVPHPYEEGMAEAWIHRQTIDYEAGRLINFAITTRRDHGLIGSIGLKLGPEGPGVGELGYWVGVSYWNRGYCTEAARAVIDYGLTVLALERIQAHHLLRNPASGRVMQKAGMQWEGVSHKVLRDGEPAQDIALYGILREEFAGPR